MPTWCPGRLLAVLLNSPDSGSTLGDRTVPSPPLPSPTLPFPSLPLTLRVDSASALRKTGDRVQIRNKNPKVAAGRELRPFFNKSTTANTLAVPPLVLLLFTVRQGCEVRTTSRSQESVSHLQKAAPNVVSKSDCFPPHCQR